MACSTGWQHCCCPCRASGERGGPQQHPWEVGAAFTEGFITYSQALLPPDDTQTAAAAAATATAAAAIAAGSGGGAIAAAAAAFADGMGPAEETVGGSSSSSSEASHQRHGVDGVRLRRRFMPYPQPYALGPALLEAQLWLLGKLLSVVTTASQLQVLEVSLYHSTPNHRMFVLCHRALCRSCTNRSLCMHLFFSINLLFGIPACPSR